MIRRIVLIVVTICSNAALASEQSRETELAAVYDIEFCNQVASMFSSDQDQRWNDLKKDYLSTRKQAPAKSSKWSSPERIMARFKAAQNDVRRRLTSLPANELYVYANCFEKLEQLEKSSPWIK